jgi:hemerythrin
MINKIYAHRWAGGIVAKISFTETIKRTIYYMRTRFVMEEDIIQQLHFHDYEVYKKREEGLAPRGSALGLLIAEVRQQAGFFESENNPNPAEFVKYLMDWILYHMPRWTRGMLPILPRWNGQEG